MFLRGATLLLPRDLSIGMWDDSALCRLTHPSLSVIAVDVFALGGQVARALVETVEAADRPEPRSEPAEPHRLELRGSTGPAPLRAVPATGLDADGAVAG